MTRLTRAVSDMPGSRALNDERSPWSVIVPEATTNLVVNPSFEASLATWTLSQDGAGFFDRVTTQSYKGGASANLIKSGGTFYVVISDFIAISANTTYTLSAYAKKVSGANVVDMVISTYTSADVLILSTSAAFPASTFDWMRMTHTRLTESNAAKIKVSFSIVASGNDNVFIDAIQLEQKAYPTTYCDGDQEGCFWTGTLHASASKRNANDRRGGRVWNLHDLGFTTMDTLGAGAPPVNVIDTPFALIGGGYYQRTTYPIRQFSILGAFESRTPVNIARTRAELWRAFKPDLVSPQQPVRLIYEPVQCRDGNNKRILVDAVYAGGLEGALANDAIDKVALGFRVHTSGIIGKAEKDTAKEIDWGSGYSQAQNFLKRNRTTGAFEQIAGNVTEVYALARAPQGGVYVGGDFNQGGSIVRIGHYNGLTHTWSALGTGGANARVQALALDANKVLYVGGNFTSIGGVAVDGIARWDGVTWSKMGTTGVAIGGGAGQVHAIAVHPLGHVYIGGNFTSVNGVAANYVARWDGVSWTALGTGMNNVVNALAISPDGQFVYAGGSFTVAGAFTANGVAVWNGARWDPVAGSLAFGGETVNSLTFDATGNLFAVGNFASGMTVAPTAKHVSSYNGATWSSLDGGFNQAGLVVFRLPDDTMFIGGEFVNDGNPVRPIPYNVIRNGNTWLNADWYPTNPRVRAAAYDNDYEYYGGVGWTDAIVGDVTTVAVNRATRPAVVINGPGNVVSLKNYTTGDAIYFNLTLLVGETATLTLGQFPKFISTFRGDILHTILGPSNLSEWELAQGSNYVFLFINVPVGAGGFPTANLVWRDLYDSIDEVA